MVDQAEKLKKMRLLKKNNIINVSNAATTGHTINSGIRIMAIASGKGGVGKTNIVVNLAIALSKAGKKVMVLDADLGMGNIDIMLGLVPRYTLNDVFHGKKSMQEIIITGPEGISIIPGGSGIYEIANLEQSQSERLIYELKDCAREMDYLLVDCGAGISRMILGFLIAVDDVLVVTTPEPTALTDAYGLIKILSRFKIKSEVFLIINMVANQQEARSTARKLEMVVDKYLEIKIRQLGYISRDETVGKTVKEQKAFLIAHPRCLAARDMQHIADNLLKKKMPAPLGLESFISKLSRLFKK